MENDAHDLPVQGRFEGREHRLGVRVYFEDTDLSGVVYHANYLRWMERGRSDMLRLAGIDQRAAHEAGEGAYAVSDLAIRYRAPARLDDALVVASRLITIRPASCRIHQRVIRSGLILADADVTAVFVSPGGRARRQPKHWVTAFERLVWTDVELSEPQTDAMGE
ncbi:MULTISPECIES: YbgC/FadM family acyl-CoA thioesterase [unclassified Sphingomonas]|uniref:YbgC/FadM family acyl-CoA thioesterase n=1 Tax=unclassified Sphingomonas TaxID=196159 RepID=UPI000BD9CC2E|nr:MAG: thioesterase [Sphingomonas sp. 32-62-10]